MVYIYLVNTCPLTASTATRIVVIPDRSIPLVHTNRDKAHPFHNLNKTRYLAFQCSQFITRITKQD
jgi:hypothetical protein